MAPSGELTAVYAGPNRRWTPSYLAVGAVEIPYVGRDKAIRTIDRSFGGAGRIRVAFCNANTMLKAFRSKRYAAALGGFVVLNDGIGVDLCSFLFTGRRFEDNLNGTDFVPELLRRTDRDLRIFLLGGAPGTAEAAGRRLGEDYPRHSVVGTHHGFFDEAAADAVVAAVNAAAPDLLLVAMGNPRQEEFIDAVRATLDVPVVMAVGALLDFMAGNVARAPDAIRALRLEWLFRLAQEPRRLGRRYSIDVAAFLLAVARFRLASLRNRDARDLAWADRRLRPAEPG